MSSSCYKQLDTRVRAIRILILLPGTWCSPIRCSLKEFLLDNGAIYEAVSYAWGNPGNTKYITVEDAQIQIPSNLEAALRHLRKPNEELRLWADAICINQQDLIEKAQQIKMMGDIFRHCTSAYIWLGIPSIKSIKNQVGGYGMSCKSHNEDLYLSSPYFAESTNENAQNQINPFTVIYHFAENKHFHELPSFRQKDSEGRISYSEDLSFKNTWEAFQDALRQPWWTRFWCVQECLLPSTAMVVFGPWRIPWKTIKLCETNYMRHILGCCSSISSLMPAEYSFYADMTVVKSRLDSNYHDDIATKVFTNLDELLRSFRYKACQDPRDKIYGILGIAELPEFSDFVVSYSLDTCSVYINAMMALLLNSGGDLRCLTGFGFNSQEHNLPSWVRNFGACPDIAALKHELTRFHSYELYSAADSSIVIPTLQSSRLLSLRGIRVDKIRLVGETVEQRNWLHVYSVLQNWYKMAGLDTPGANSKHHTFGEDEKEFLSAIVADAIVEGERGWQRMRDDDMKGLRHWLHMVLRGMEKGTELSTELWVRTMFSATYGRSMYRTEKNHFGMCYPGSLPGDELWVLHGGRVPFVLRPSRQTLGNNTTLQHYRLIGDSYLYGFMDGEGMRDAHSQTQEVVIC